MQLNYYYLAMNWDSFGSRFKFSNENSTIVVCMSYYSKHKTYIEGAQTPNYYAYYYCNPHRKTLLHFEFSKEK